MWPSNGGDRPRSAAELCVAEVLCSLDSEPALYGRSVTPARAVVVIARLLPLTVMAVSRRLKGMT